MRYLIVRKAYDQFDKRTEALSGQTRRGCDDNLSVTLRACQGGHKADIQRRHGPGFRRWRPGPLRVDAAVHPSACRLHL